MPSQSKENHWNVIIVGAGPAGLGCARALQCAGVERVLVLEREAVGSSFQDWPAEMRLITPSFNANSFDHPDLNSICPSTSPADMLGVEHLSGLQYAGYLLAFALHFGLEIQEGVNVKKVVPLAKGFEVITKNARFSATKVIWAAGEFYLPTTRDIPGAHLGHHTSTVKFWGKVKGRDFIVIGGYESGIDAAYHLANKGAKVRVLSSKEPWNSQSSDPSEALSPYTKSRLRSSREKYPKRIRLMKNSKVLGIKKKGRQFVVETTDREFRSPNPPLLATGFQSALTPIKELFEWSDGTPEFNENDESTLHRGLFYSGPSLVHEGSKFCFIYKFRARFGVIAKVIAQELGGDIDGLEFYERRGLVMEDLSCCLDCRCEIESDEEANSDD